MSENELQRIDVERPFMDGGLMTACPRPGQRLEPRLRERQRCRVENYPFFFQPREPGLHENLTVYLHSCFKGLICISWAIWPWERFVSSPPPPSFSADHTCRWKQIEELTARSLASHAGRVQCHPCLCSFGVRAVRKMEEQGVSQHLPSAAVLRISHKLSHVISIAFAHC